MNKICTSLEQSKKLMELGIDVYTADMYYDVNSYGTQSKPEVAVGKVWSKDIPAWSLSALLKLLPSEFTTENEFGKYKYEIKIRKYKLTDNVDLHQIAYGNYRWHEDGGHTWSDMVNTGQKEELIDAAFQMVVWLLENKKL